MGLSELTTGGHDGGGALRLHRQRLEQARRLLLPLSHEALRLNAMVLRLLMDGRTDLRLVEHRQQRRQPAGCHNLLAHGRLTDGKAAQRGCRLLLHLRPLVRQQRDERHDSTRLDDCCTVLLGERQHLDLGGGRLLLPCGPVAQPVDRVAEDEHQRSSRQTGAPWPSGVPCACCVVRRGHGSVGAVSDRVSRVRALPSKGDTPPTLKKVVTRTLAVWHF